MNTDAAAREEQAFVVAMRAAGLRVTPQRQLVLAALAGADSPHRTADAIWEVVRARHGGINRSTVYRVLDQFTEARLVVRHLLAGGVAHYELAGAGVHHHLLCRRCGAVYDVDPADVLDAIRGARERFGFVLGASAMTLEGECRACAQIALGATDPAVPPRRPSPTPGRPRPATTRAATAGN